MRFFNTAGPVNPADHYCLDLLVRIDLPLILPLIEQKKYFVLHAPRQTGKTSCLLALQSYLNARDRYRCLYVNVEGAQAAREDVAAAMQAILHAAQRQAGHLPDSPLAGVDILQILANAGPYDALHSLLERWSQASDRPLVVLFDEVDALIGDTLIAFLRQLRAGYTNRPARFPQTVMLCGVRDVRDYRIHSAAGKEIITGGSAFNIKAESLRLGNLSEPEVRALYQQHTTETGQVFTRSCPGTSVGFQPGPAMAGQCAGL